MNADGPIAANPMSGSSIFLLLFGAWGKIGINCFVMITGYFMCRSQITAKKFVKLLAEVMLYRIVIFLIFLAAGYERIGAKSLLRITLLEKPFFRWWDRHWDGFAAAFRKKEDKILRKLKIE